MVAITLYNTISSPCLSVCSCVCFFSFLSLLFIYFSAVLLDSLDLRRDVLDNIADMNIVLKPIHTNNTIGLNN